MDALAVKIAFAFIFSFLITYYLVPFFSHVATRLQFLDHPDGSIKTHSHAVPYMGGVAVYGGFLSALAFTIPFDSNVSFLIIGTTLLLLLGLTDDLMPLAPYQKFFGQFIIGLSFLKAGFYLKEHLFYNIWNMPLSLLWILTVINAFNLVDVMDGLATTLAISASITFFIMALILGNSIPMIMLAAFIGALGAFLVYNKPPAKIYLGDAGSLFIGGFLAVIPFLLDWGTYSSLGFIAPIIILAIPLLECSALILIRTYKGIPFYQGSPDHFSSYLLANGWRKSHILLYTILLSIILGSVAGILVTGFIEIPGLLFLGATFLIVWIGLFFWK